MPRLTLGDVELAYELAGEGSPVLLIQGVGTTGSAWRPQLDGLADRHALAAFDNRGIGASTAPKAPLTIEAMAGDGLALMDALGWKSAHVVGHSMGGVIAQALALRAPDRVRSLSLLCTFARGSDGATPKANMLWLAIRTMIGTRPMRRRAFVQLVMPRSVCEGADLDAMADELAPLMGRDLATSPPIIRAQLRAMGAFDAYARLSALESIPTLVVSATEDRIAPPSSGRELADAIGTARFVVMNDAAHAVPIQRAAEVNALLAEHFAAADQASAPRSLSQRSRR